MTPLTKIERANPVEEAQDTQGEGPIHVLPIEFSEHIMLIDRAIELAQQMPESSVREKLVEVAASALIRILTSV